MVLPVVYRLESGAKIQVQMPRIRAGYSGGNLSGVLDCPRWELNSEFGHAQLEISGIVFAFVAACAFKSESDMIVELFINSGEILALIRVESTYGPSPIQVGIDSLALAIDIIINKINLE